MGSWAYRNLRDQPEQGRDWAVSNSDVEEIVGLVTDQRGSFIHHRPRQSCAVRWSLHPRLTQAQERSHQRRVGVCGASLGAVPADAHDRRHVTSDEPRQVNAVRALPCRRPDRSVARPGGRAVRRLCSASDRRWRWCVGSARTVQRRPRLGRCPGGCRHPLPGGCRHPLRARGSGRVWRTSAFRPSCSGRESKSGPCRRRSARAIPFSRVSHIGSVSHRHGDALRHRLLFLGLFRGAGGLP